MNKRLIRIIFFTIGILLVFNLSRSIIDMLQKGGSLDKEEERFARIKLENEQLSSEYDKLQSPEYIEKQAREKLGLSREGETVVILPPQSNPQKAKDMNKSSDTNQAIWRQWLSFFLE